jgi:hypothetical protein
MESGRTGSNKTTVQTPPKLGVACPAYWQPPGITKHFDGPVDWIADVREQFSNASFCERNRKVIFGKALVCEVRDGAGCRVRLLGAVFL